MQEGGLWSERGGPGKRVQNNTAVEIKYENKERGGG